MTSFFWEWRQETNTNIRPVCILYNIHRFRIKYKSISVKNIKYYQAAELKCFRKTFQIFSLFLTQQPNDQSLKIYIIGD